MAAKNALRTGVYANAIVMPGESQADFEELCAELLIELGSRGVLEASLVHELAAIIWRKSRLDRLEHRALMQRINAPVMPEEYFEVGLERTPDSEWAVANLKLLNSDFLLVVDRQEQLAKSLINLETRSQTISEIQHEHPDLYDRLVQWVSDVGDLELRRGIDIIALMQASDHAGRSGSYGRLINALGAPLGYRLLKECKNFRAATEILPKIEVLGERIREHRLADIIFLDGASRARDDLNRGFFRILKELRQQQEWRKRNDVIDVTPSP